MFPRLPNLHKCVKFLDVWAILSRAQKFYGHRNEALWAITTGTQKCYSRITEKKVCCCRTDFCVPITIGLITRHNDWPNHTSSTKSFTTTGRRAKTNMVVLDPANELLSFCVLSAPPPPQCLMIKIIINYWAVGTTSRGVPCTSPLKGWDSFLKS